MRAYVPACPGLRQPCHAGLGRPPAASLRPGPGSLWQPHRCAGPDAGDLCRAAAGVRCATLPLSAAKHDPPEPYLRPIRKHLLAWSDGGNLPCRTSSCGASAGTPRGSARSQRVCCDSVRPGSPPCWASCRPLHCCARCWLPPHQACGIWPACHICSLCLPSQSPFFGMRAELGCHGAQQGRPLGPALSPHAGQDPSCGPLCP